MLTVDAQTTAGRSGATTAEAIAREGLSRAAADAFGAWVTTDAGAAEKAREIDARAAELPLAGVTVGVKDLFSVAGLPRHAGSRLTSDQPSITDAGAVARLRELGASIIGTTTMPEFAFGPTPGALNPLAPDHTPGSSSAGSAIAVAAGQVAVGLATQTNGSVIRPAAFCGVAALKPTQGSLPTDGLPRLVPTLDQPGLIAADATSLQALWSAWHGMPIPDAAEAPVVALVRTSRWSSADPPTREAIDQLADELGCPEITVPDSFDDAWSWMDTIIAVELAENLAEHDARFDELTAPIRETVTSGRTTSPLQYADALAGREALTAWTEEQLGRVDAVITPAAPGPAPLLVDGAGSPEFCTLWSLAGAPAATIPLPGHSGPLPVGLQLVAAHGRDSELLAVAAALQRGWPGH